MTAVNPIERFDPLLRSLLTWNLVEQGDEGRWELPAAVTQRLAELSALTRSDTPSEVVYFGHACSVCGTSGLTRRRGERYLCDKCRHADALAAVATPLPKPSERRSRRWLLHRGGLAS